MRKVAAIFLFAMAVAATPDAQELAASISSYTPFGIDDLDAKLPVSAELRVTFPISDRFALEPFVTKGTTQHFGNEGFYGLQVRQLLIRSLQTDVFVTYGVAALYARARVSAPYIGDFGAGLKWRVLKHLAIRPEVHLITFRVIPVGARLGLGVSVL